MGSTIKPIGYSSYSSNPSNQTPGHLKPAEKVAVPSLTISDKQPEEILRTVDPNQVNRAIDQTEVKNINPNDTMTLLAQADEILRTKKNLIRKTLRSAQKIENCLTNNPFETNEDLLSIIEAFERDTIEGSESSLSDKDKELLQAVLPDSIRENLKIFPNLKHLRKVLQLSVGYINSIKMGQSDVIIIYKTHLFDESNALKKEIGKEVDRIPGRANKNSFDLEGLKADLIKWKTALDVQNDDLDTFYLDTFSLGLSTGVSVIENIINFLPLRYLPSKWILESGQKALMFSKGVVDVLGFLSASINLFYKGKAHKHAKQWLANFNKWTKRSEISTKTKSKPITSHKNLTPEEHKAHLHQFLQKSSLKKIKIFLSNHSIDPLPDKIDTLDDFKQAMKHKELRESIENQYIKFQGTIQGFDLFIDTAQNIYDKRMLMQEKKIFQIKHEIDSLKPMIKNTQLGSFKNSMGKLLNELGTTNHQRLSGIQLEIFENELTRWKQTIYHPLQTDPITNLLKQLPKLSEGDLSSHQKFSNDFESFVFGKGQMESYFDDWFDEQTVDELCKFHVDHQETYLKSTKTSVVNLISKKFRIEKKFINFDYLSSIQSFLSSGTWLLITISTIALAIFAITVPGLGWFILALTIGDILLTVGLLATKSYLDFKYKPRSTLLYYLQQDLHAYYLKARLEIREFLNKNKEKKLLSSVSALRKLGVNSSEKDRVEEQFKRIREEYNKGLTIAQEWEKKIQKSEAYVNKKRLLDFHSFSGINPVKDFPKFKDYLQKINDALSHCDPKMIDLEDDMKYILETFFGLDLKVIQREMSENPNVFKEKLASFLSMSQNDMINFFKYQNLIQNNLISNN